MEMHERIKKVRKDNNMTQSEFAKCLGVTRSVISNLELNRLAKPEQKTSLIKLISKEFSINEEWLLNGTGEMFAKNSNELLDQLAAKYNLKDVEKQAFEALLTLDENDRDKISNLIKNLYNGGFFDINKDDEVTATEETDINEYEVEAYRQELIAEQKGEIYSVSEDLEENSENQNLA